MSIPMYFTKRALKKPGTKITHETFNVEAIRENAKQSEQMKPVKGVRFEERVYGGVTVDVAIPEDRKTDNAILYIHIKENVDVYVTGSNSRMLSSDILTQFRDRGDEIRVNPLSFAEVYEH